MNSDGQIYEGIPRDPDDIDVTTNFLVLKEMNRRGRRAYYAEIKHGASAEVALIAARCAHMTDTKEPK